MLEFFHKNPDAGAVGCKIINPDGTLQLACRRGFPSPGVAFFKIVGLSGLFPNSKIFGGYNLTYLDPDEVHEVDALSGSFMMFRRETYTDVGFLDEDYFMYGEDLDYCYRIKKAGWKIYYVPHAEIIHFKGESVKKISFIKSLRLFYGAMKIFVSKHFKGRFMFPLRCLISLGIIFRFIWAGVEGAARVAFIPLVDLILINFGLILGINLRFGSKLSDLITPVYDYLNLTEYDLPMFSTLELVTIFSIYSVIYMSCFIFVGVYRRYSYSAKRAALGSSLGLVFIVFIVFFLRYNVSFLKETNLSRLVAVYSWIFDIILVSGWRLMIRAVVRKSSGTSFGRKRILVVGVGEQGRFFAKVVRKNPHLGYEMVGFVDPESGNRGESVDGYHVLGLTGDLGELVTQYRIQEVILASENVPYSEILKVGTGFRLTQPRFLIVPDSFHRMYSDEKGISSLPLISLTPE